MSAWDDLSGSGHSLVQATGGLQPATGTRTHNGLNVLDFDGGDNLYDSTAALPVDIFQVFVVAAQDSAADFVGVVSATPSSGNDNNSADGWVVEAGQNNSTPALNANHGSAPARIFQPRPFPAAVYHGVATSTSAQLTLYKNGAAGGLSGGRNGAGATSSGVLVGQRYLGGVSGAYGLDGWIGEIIVYDSVLSVADTNTVGNYLADKWGFTWADLT